MILILIFFQARKHDLPEPQPDTSKQRSPHTA
jgi:hypothetical protein